MMNTNTKTYNQYNSLPSHELVLVIKACKLLLNKKPEHSVALKNTITMIRDIMIKRQKVK